MRGRAYLISVGAGFIAATLVPFAAATAKDATYCVTCTGPDQTYLCQVTGEGLRATDALKLYCIVRTAKEGGHASCAARNETSGCHGLTKVYSYDGPSLPASFAAREDVGPEPFAEQPDVGDDGDGFAEPGETKGGGPKTLVEATGRAYTASRRGIRNVRASLGGRSEEHQSALPADSGVAIDPLPDLPGETPSPLSPLPLSATPSATETALLPPAHESGSPPPAESKGRIRRGAQNVGKFAKKSYRCMRSLFRHCGGPEATAPN